MPIITPDVSQVGNIQPGTYPGEILAIEHAKGKEKGTPFLKTTFKLEVEGKSRTRITNVFYTGGGAWQFDQLLRACGLSEEADKIKNNPGYEFDTDSLIGQRCNVVTDLKMHNGQERDEIKSFLPL